MRRTASPQLKPPLAFGYHDDEGDWADAYDAFKTLTTLQSSAISQLTELALEFESIEDAADGLLYVLSDATSLTRMHVVVSDFDNNYAAAKPDTVQQLSAVRCPTVRILELEMFPTAYTALGDVLLQALPNLERLDMDVAEGAGYDSSDGDGISSKNQKSKSKKKKAVSRIPRTTLSKLRRASFYTYLPLEVPIARTSAANLHHLCISTASTAVLSAIYNAGLTFPLPIRTLHISVDHENSSSDDGPNLQPIGHMKRDDRGLAIIRVLPYLEQLVVLGNLSDPLQILDAVCGSLRALYLQRHDLVVQTIGDALKENHRALARLRLYGLPWQLDPSLPKIQVPAIFGERRIKVQKYAQFLSLISGTLEGPDATHF